MNRIIFVVVAVLVLGAILVSGLVLTKRDGTGEEVESGMKVGVILPLTGEFGEFGMEMKRGIELAWSGSSSDNTSSVIFEDNQFLPAATASAAKKLIEIDKVDALLVFSIDDIKPIADYVNEKHIPTLVIWDDNQFTSTVGDYVFSNGYSTEKAGEAMANFATQELKLQRIAVVRHSDPWAEIIYPAYKSSLVAQGGEILFEEIVEVGTADFRTILLKIKSLDSQAIYFPLLPPDNYRFVKQAREVLGRKAVLLTGDAFTPDAIEAAGPAAEGVYLTNLPQRNDEALKTKYFQAYNMDMVLPDAVWMGYDATRVLLNARMTGDVKQGLLATYRGEHGAGKEEVVYEITPNGVMQVQ